MAAFGYEWGWGLVVLAVLGLVFWLMRVRLYLWLARSALNRGEYRKALAVLQWAHAVQPHSDLIHVQIARCLYLAEAYPQALSHFEQALALNPSQAALLHYNRGLTLAKMQQTPEAIAAFRENLALEPGNAKAFWHMGEQYLVMGNLENARIAAERALTLDPGLEQARKLLERSFQLDPKRED